MNPIELAREIEERYRRYLKTTFYFKDPKLRVSFEEALSSGHLSKGPYLEATPVFKRGQTPRALFRSSLGLEPDQVFLNVMQENTPLLYQHQEQAIQRVFEGHNVVVATGTGSGKTEAFLYPILIHLYQEFKGGKLYPGVRALILYPMNALANDQRERLGEIRKRLDEGNSSFRFTFGQYIGETPRDENDSRGHARDHMANRLPGELVLRSEMRREPPHILLTNYSMLEYLLLRPYDSPVFDNGRARWWTFLVLDEAHQYRGSRGIEMAMLLQRLKQRLREGGRSQPFRCIATSATLVGGEGDRAAVAKFASDLFGEEFWEEDVILGESEPIHEPGPEKLSLEDYEIVGQALCGKSTEAKSSLAKLATELGVPFPDKEDLPKTVGRLLERDSRATGLRRLITGNPAEVQGIAAQVFDDLPDEKRVAALSELVELLLHAKNPATDTALFSARYHLFLRSLEGAYVSYWPEKKVFLDRKVEDQKHTAFEVALCRECGQHYFVGPKDFKPGKLVEAIRDPSHDSFGATFFRPIENIDEEDEEGESSDATNKKVFQLCVQCGEMRKGKPKCEHNNSIQVVREESPKDEDRADQMAKCGACGYNAAGHDPVRELVHGTDGPNAVIATTLYQSLPEKRKKVLAFTDGRQEAAFFAWYLEDSYKHILSRNLLLKVVQRLNPHAPEGLSLREVATGLRGVFQDRKVFPPATGDIELRREAWLELYQEFLTDEPRISLEGVGLVMWSVKWPDWFKIPKILRNPPWELAEQEAWDLLSILLHSMRADRAVELRTENSVSLSWNDLSLQGRQALVLMNEKGELKKGEKRWSGRTGKRVRFLAKLLMRMKDDLSQEKAIDQAVEALRVAWDHAKQSDENAPSSHDRLLIPVDDARRLNPDWWRLSLITDDDKIFQCDTCGRLQSVSVRAVCPRHRCPGTLKEVHRVNLEPNHYRFLYEEDLPGTLRVEEHTAQLDKEKAREFQREFREDKIHVLSCSTTFELGVDLGNLDNIFLRNVPPEAFNYAQRVGRAGRRTGYPGFAVTYCRRGPHDLYHFAEPERMLGGRVRPPVLSLRNEKIIMRHIAATALSAFFRAFPERFETVDSLFRDLTNPSGVADFIGYLHKHQTQLEETVSAIVPPNPDLIAKLGLLDRGWIADIAGDKSRFSDAEAEVSSDYKNAVHIKDTAKQTDDFKTAQWAVGRLKDITEEDVLSFLSRKAVIPKYGFPVDVVELDTQRTQQNQEAFEVLLQRDLSIAISEFAPTSKLVANKKVWTSYALKRVAEKEWDRWWYAKCAKHNRFERKVWSGESQAPSFDKCCTYMVITQYIDPKFGFVTNRDKPEEPKARPPKVFTTRPYFAGFKDKEGEKISFGLITLSTVSPGYMVVLSEGRRAQGFYICGACGAGFRNRKKIHQTPYGQDCHGVLGQVSLAHEFVTDVLQLQFHPIPQGDMERVWFAYSLAYAVVEGAAEVLEVPSTDLNATVAYSEQYPIPPIILYDNVPGGAGLVARLEREEVLQECLEIAKERISNCDGCGETSSCYSCLRSYRNQFAHQYLQRGPVMHYLEALLSK